MSGDLTTYDTLEFPEKVITAPDGSEIRELLIERACSMVHCRLPAAGISMAVRHKSVVELWHIVGGSGVVWRKPPDEEGSEVAVQAGMTLRIPVGWHFQFRADDEGALEILIVTLPPWPSMDEAVRVEDHWPVGTPA